MAHGKFLTIEERVCRCMIYYILSCQCNDAQKKLCISLEIVKILRNFGQELLKKKVEVL